MFKYISIGLGALLLGSLVGNYFLYDANSDLHEAVATEKGNVARLTDEVKQVSADLQKAVVKAAQDQIRMDALSEKARVASAEAAAATARLNQWRKNLEAEMVKNPEAVARAAGLAFRRVLRDIEQASRGEQDGADAQHVPPATAAPDSSTRD